MQKLLFVSFIALAAITSFFVELFYCSASLLASFRGFVRKRAAMLAAMLGFSFMSLTACASELAEGVTFFGILVETWALLPMYAQIIGVLWLLVPVFSVVVSLTDTPMDDNLWGKWIYPILEKLAMVSFKAKQKPGDSYLLKPFK